MSAPVVVENLNVVVSGDDGAEIPIVRDVSFSINAGNVLALIGESGSGKTTIALSLLGWARPGCHIVAGNVCVGDTDMLSLSARELSRLRGNRVTYVAQSAAAAFNPSQRIMDQVIESTLQHGLSRRKQARDKAVHLFEKLALPDPGGIGDRYPHQVSGGQLQRLMAAMALIVDPDLIIFDEPTTALDVTTQIDVLQAFKNAVDDWDTTAVYVSHDLAVVAQIADDVVVLKDGGIRESSTTEQILSTPEDDYTKTLLGAVDSVSARDKATADEPLPLLEMRGVSAGYGSTDRDGIPENRVLKDVDLSIGRGRTVGVIGESGSGKSTIARVIAGLLDPFEGEVSLNGETLPGAVQARRREQLKNVQIVFQYADTALNPAHTVAQVLARPIEFYHGETGPESRQRIKRLLDMIRLPASIADQNCAELSGGQKQRVNLARALAAEPALVLCDEVTSALDTVVAAAIMDLLMELQQELGLAYLFVSHDISVVQSICDDIVVLLRGEVVESASSSAFRTDAHHPYTERLLLSVPELYPGWLASAQLKLAALDSA